MLDRRLGDLFPNNRHYIFDSKNDDAFDNYPGLVATDTCPAKMFGSRKYQVWRPVHIIPEEVEKWLHQVWADPPAILSVDELVHLRYKANLYSPMYEAIQKTGRQRKILTITGTQELSKIPANAYKMASHRFGFYIDKAAMYDRHILDMLLKAKVEMPPDPFGFYYQSEKGRTDPLYFSSIQVFLGG